MERLKAMAPDNLTLVPSVAYEDTPSIYRKAKVYAQLSYREGLPNAVCESMLCECIVVGSDIPGIRAAVGDSGIIIPYGDVSKTIEAINQAIEMDGSDGRAWIINQFSLKKREKALVETIEQLLS